MAKQWGVMRKALEGGVIVAAILAVCFRLIGLEEAPPGFHADEASIGYNALSIGQTAKDEHGALMPLYFRAFGEYKNPVFIYASVPAVAIIGAEPVALRGMAALFGLGTCALIGLAIFIITRDRWWAVAGFAAAGFLPWLVLPGRVAFEAGCLPFFLLLGWILWVRGMESGRPWWFLLSGLAHGIAFYAYSTGRAVAPMQLLVMALIHRKAGKGRIASALGIFALSLVPAIIWWVYNPGSLEGRFAEVSVFARAEGPVGAAARFLLNLVRYLSPAFLFADGDPNLRHHTGTGGVLFLFLIPGIFYGITLALRKDGDPRLRSIFFLFILFPLVPSLTHRSFHILRSIHGAPFVALLAMIGTREIFRVRLGEGGGSRAGSEGSPGGPEAGGDGPPDPEAEPSQDGRPPPGLLGPRLLAVILLGSAALEVPHYVYDLYRKYPDRAAAHFQAGVGDAVRYALTAREGPIYYEPALFVDERGVPNQPEIQILFWGGLDPATYQAEGMKGLRCLPWKDGESVPPGSRVILKEGKAGPGWQLISDNFELARGAGGTARVYLVPPE